MHPAVKGDTKYLTAGQAAKILGVHRQTVYDRVKAGTLLPSARTAEGVMVFSRDYIEAIRDKEASTQGVQG